MSELANIDWNLVVWHLNHLAIAYVLALPIGWDRERNTRSAGLRTFPLVSVASCAYMLTGIEVLDSTDAESRVMYGLITGMGFIGGGAILKEKGSVTGTATAASLWNTGALGTAVAWNRYEIALVLCVLNVVTLQVLGGLKAFAGGEARDGRD